MPQKDLFQKQNLIHKVNKERNFSTNLLQKTKLTLIILMQKNLIIPKDSGKQDHIFLTTDWLK